MDKPKKQIAALYCRLSKEDVDKVHEGDESASIINQRILLTEYALGQEFEIYDTYMDDDYSGLFNDRPGFERLIEDAKLQKFNVVIAKSQSRFTRNMEHMEKYLHTMFPLLGIRFIGVVDNADTLNKGNKKSRQINGLVNEWYCEDLSENIKAVFQAKMKRGQYLAPSTPYGYLKDPNDHNHLIIDEYAAEIVKKIFRLYIEGNGKQGIANLLSEEGVLIPSIYKTKILGQNYYNSKAKENTKYWTYQTVHQILNNEVYIGNMVQYRYKTISYKSRKKVPVSKDEWIRVENTHDPIIDKETWALVQEIGKQKNRSVQFNQKLGLFSNKLYCKDCGSYLTRKYNNKHEFVGYFCSTYKKFGNKRCSSHFIADQELQEIVLESIKQEAANILTKADMEELDALSVCQKAVSVMESSREKLCKQLEDLQRYRKKAYEDYADGILDKDEYLSLKEKFRLECSEIEKSIEAVDQKIHIANDEDRQKKNYDTWAEKFKNYIDVDELDRSMIVQLIDKIEIDTAGNIEIQYQFANPCYTYSS